MWVLYCDGVCYLLFFMYLLFVVSFRLICATSPMLLAIN